MAKLLGKSIGYQLFVRTVNAIWKPRGELEILVLGHDFFLIKFDLDEDMESVLTKGPWTIQDHYFIACLWTLDFDPVLSTVQSMLAWVRLPGLSMLYFEENALKAISSCIGKPVKIDS